MTENQIKTFQIKILTWYAKNKRDLPWRKTRDPYRILVSEVMSQQTQLSRVIPKYEKWIETLPTIIDLARASTTDVLRLWSGLGYNRRALYLKKTADTVVRHYNGIFPKDSESLKKLPGIGEYTASAIACFAFDEQVAVLDTNVRKVILITFFSKDSSIAEKDLQKFADKLLPQGKAYEWNQALMDYAAKMLKQHKIPIPKQSKFIGSNRYYRGKIIKLLLEKHQVNRSKLEELIGYNKRSAKGSLDSIIHGMIIDGLIKQEKHMLLLV